MMFTEAHVVVFTPGQRSTAVALEECCLLFVVCCLLFVVCCLLFVVSSRRIYFTYLSGTFVLLVRVVSMNDGALRL